MFQEALSLSIFIVSLMITSVLPVSTEYSNVYVNCSQLNFTPMTPYESNVNSLFTSLVNSASIYNFNKFETSPQTDGIYGLFQCRGDLNSTNCQDCVASAVSQLRTTCPASTGGEIQLEGCLVKYDNTSFFGVEGMVEVCRRCGPSIGYNSDVLNRIDDALAYLVGGGGQYFRGGDFGSIQGVAQCVQDLSLSDCQDCLLVASGRLRSACVTSTWGDMYLSKCYIRYADQGNENLANNRDTSSNKRSGGSKNNIWKWAKWIGIIIGIVVGVGTLTCVVKNCCNINVYNKVIQSLKNDVEGAKKEAEAATSEAKSAKELAEKAEKIAEEGSIKSGYPFYVPSPYPYFSY